MFKGASTKLKNVMQKYRITLIAVIFLTTIGFLIHSFGVTINLTSSMPRGLYIKQLGAVKRGDIVALCLHAPYKNIGLEREYIGKGRECAGLIPLIKKIVAVIGDDIYLNDAYLVINGKKLNYPTQYIDSKNRPLKVYPRGKYLHTRGYWLIGTSDKKSWDSRYFGPVAESQILHKLKPVFVFLDP